MDEAKPLSSDEFPIDMELVKVLASDSRRDILRLLQRRRMTLSEMSSALDLKKATVLEHLKKLTDAGLIRRIDDERLWVYYELTHRGGRLVNPGRTRFFLVLGWAAAAAIVLAGAATLALTFSDLGEDADKTASRDGLQLELADPRGGLAAGAPVTLRAVLQTDEGPVAPARAALLSSPDADVSQGVPLEASAATGPSVEFRSAGPVPAGDYYLYVADAQGRDNAGNLTPVRVPAYVAEGPATLWRGVSDAARFHLLRDGEPVNGTLILWGPEGDANRTVEPVSAPEGVAVLDAARVDSLRAGTYAMQALTEQAFEPFPLASRVIVREPLAIVAPLDLLAGGPAALTVTLALGENAPDGADVRVDGEPVATSSVAPGVVGFALDATAPGPRNVTVGRLASREVVVHPSLDVALEPTGDGAHRLTSAPNVTFTLDDAALATTNDSGFAVVSLPQGKHALAARAAGEPVFRTFLAVEGWNVSTAPASFGVFAEEVLATHDELRLRVRVGQALGEASEALVTATLDGIAFAVERVPPTADGVTLRLAMPPTGEHRLALRAEPTPPVDAVVFRNGTSLGGRSEDASPPQAPGATTPRPVAGADVYVYEAWATSKSSSAELRVFVPPPPAPFALTPVPTTAPTAVGVAAEPEVPAPGVVLVLLTLAALALLTRRRR